MATAPEIEHAENAVMDPQAAEEQGIGKGLGTNQQLAERKEDIWADYISKPAQQSNMRNIVKIAFGRRAVDVASLQETESHVFLVKWTNSRNEDTTLDFRNYPSLQSLFKERYRSVKNFSSPLAHASGYEMDDTTTTQQVQTWHDGQYERILALKQLAQIEEAQRREQYGNSSDAATDDEGKIIFPPPGTNSLRQITDTRWGFALNFIQNYTVDDVLQIEQVDDHLYFLKMRDTNEVLLDLSTFYSLSAEFAEKFSVNGSLTWVAADIVDRALWEQIGERSDIHLATATDLGEAMWLLEWKDSTVPVTVVDLMDCSDACYAQFEIRFGTKMKPEEAQGIPPKTPEMDFAAESLANIELEGGYSDSDDEPDSDSSRPTTPVAVVRRQIGTHKQSTDGRIDYWSIDGDKLLKPSAEDIEDYWYQKEPFSNNHIELSSSEDDWEEVRKIGRTAR